MPFGLILLEMGKLLHGKATQTPHTSVIVLYSYSGLMDAKCFLQNFIKVFVFSLKISDKLAKLNRLLQSLFMLNVMLGISYSFTIWSCLSSLYLKI